MTICQCVCELLRGWMIVVGGPRRSMGSTRDGGVAVWNTTNMERGASLQLGTVLRFRSHAPQDRGAIIVQPLKHFF